MPSWQADAELFRIQRDAHQPRASLARVKTGTLGLLADEVMALHRADRQSYAIKVGDTCYGASDIEELSNVWA